MDPKDEVGFSGVTAPPGQSQYDFWCEDAFGQSSNVVSPTVLGE